MAHTVDSRAGTPANDLRDLLDTAERELPVLTSAGLTAYLLRLDQIDVLLTELAAADLRSEQTRWEDLQIRLSKRAGNLVSLAGPLGGFAALRRAHPPATGAWWHFDELAASRRNTTLRNVVVALLVAAGLLVLATFIYQRFLAPSPQTILVVDTLTKVEELTAAKQWAEAQRLTEAALQTVPNDQDLLVQAVVLAERMGDAAKVAAYTARATQVMADPVHFQLALGMRRLQASDIDGAEQAANAVLAVKPREAQAFFILGNVAEARGKQSAAIDYFNQAATLAADTNPELTVISKVRVAALLQQQGAGPEPAPTGSTPTP